MIGWDKSHAPADAKIKNVVFTNNLYLREDVLPKDMPIRDSKVTVGDPGFVRPGGLKASDYKPGNVSLVKDRGIVIDTLPGDKMGITSGLAVRADFFGNPISGLPDLGAVEVGQ